MTRTVATLFGLAALALATQASAHAHLTASNPAANAKVAAPKQLTLRFSEKLNPTFSGLSLTMPQMHDMTVPAKVAVSKDRLSLVAMPNQPLSAGVYKVNWHAVSADTHRVQGAFTFSVR